MWCPRCQSTRVQRGYNDAAIVLRVAGFRELLCNNCGLEFKGFDPFRRLPRAPARHRETNGKQRRFPRYKVHFPATIAMVERNPLTWDVSYSKGCRGHCDMISQGGMALSFVGSHLPEDELTRPGCRLFVTVNLPGSVVAAVLSTVTCDRLAAMGKWMVGAKITQMSDLDAKRLACYLAKRATIQ
jgi:hypothetical protein